MKRDTGGGPEPGREPRRKRTRPAAAPPRGERRALFLGVGLDGDSGEEAGHRRITRGRDVLLVGGSKETHERMQEKAVRFNEELDRRGLRLADVRCAEELREIADRAGL